MAKFSKVCEVMKICKIKVMECVLGVIAMPVVLLGSCVSRPSEEGMLERSLEFAGDNRSELEAVLEHYKGDKEKLEAAKFLVRNMPHYYSYQGWQLDTINSMLKWLSKIHDVSDMTVVADYSLEHPNLTALKKVYDARVITSSYLIDNIDRAFAVWKTKPWNHSLSFDDFCELILPYRIANEPLTDWRRMYEGRYLHLLDSVYYGNDVIEACRVVNSALNAEGCEYYSRFCIPHLAATFLFDNRIGSCRESCDIGIYAMRACGIPVATDNYKWSPSYQGNHQWLVVRDTTGQYVQFGFDGVVPNRQLTNADGRKKGKVYRDCFGRQLDMVERLCAMSHVPASLANTYQKDVTDNYFGENEVKVTVDANSPSDIFLGVFKPKGWIPVGMSEKIEDTVVFRNIEPNVVYAPVAFIEKEYKAVGFPFMLDGKKLQCRIIKGDVSCKEPMSLRRKMPLMPLMKMRLGKCIVGARVEASEDSLFSHPFLIHKFEKPLDYYTVKLVCHSMRRFRYLRYVAPHGVPMELAEFKVYADSACKTAIPLHLSTAIPKVYAPDNIIDGDILTAFYAPIEYRNLVFDMEKQQTVGAIDFCPRTDGNFIFSGDTYELLYHAGAEGWKSLGAKQSHGRTVDFVGPYGALFWLRDITRGREEQVFLYENGRQVFVEDMSGK